MKAKRIRAVPFMVWVTLIILSLMFALVTGSLIFTLMGHAYIALTGSIAASVVYAAGLFVWGCELLLVAKWAKGKWGLLERMTIGRALSVFENDFYCFKILPITGVFLEENNGQYSFLSEYGEIETVKVKYCEITVCPDNVAPFVMVSNKRYTSESMERLFLSLSYDTYLPHFNCLFGFPSGTAVVKGRIVIPEAPVPATPKLKPIFITH